MARLKDLDLYIPYTFPEHWYRESWQYIREQFSPVHPSQLAEHREWLETGIERVGHLDLEEFYKRAHTPGSPETDPDVHSLLVSRPMLEIGIEDLRNVSARIEKVGHDDVLQIAQDQLQAELREEIKSWKEEKLLAMKFELLALLWAIVEEARWGKQVFVAETTFGNCYYGIERQRGWRDRLFGDVDLVLETDRMERMGR